MISGRKWCFLRFLRFRRKNPGCKRLCLLRLSSSTFSGKKEDSLHLESKGLERYPIRHWRVIVGRTSSWMISLCFLVDAHSNGDRIISSRCSYWTQWFFQLPSYLVQWKSPPTGLFSFILLNVQNPGTKWYDEHSYCWRKKSQTTTWDVSNPEKDGINYISTGGCRISEPSTVSSWNFPGFLESSGQIIHNISPT